MDKTFRIEGEFVIFGDGSQRLASEVEKELWASRKRSDIMLVLFSLTCLILALCCGY